MKSKDHPIFDRENFEIKISKEELSTLEAQKFVGDIIVVDTPEIASEAVEDLKKETLIGFDTETKPAFQKGRINQVALLQLATPHKSYLFRLSKIGLPQGVKELLESESLLKVGLSIKDDFHSLARLGGLAPRAFIDLQEFVREYGIADSALTKIHAIVFGKRISKSQQLTNWEASELTRRQQEYAALDALACINIYKALKNGDFKPDSSKYKKLKVQDSDHGPK